MEICWTTRPCWGYTRLRGALHHLGHEIGRNTSKRVLNDHGIEPAPERGQKTPWKTFMTAHWDAIAAADFFTVEVLTVGGLVRYSVFFVMRRETRKVEIAGITCIGERHLRLAVTEYAEHYHAERPHRGLGNQLIEALEGTVSPGEVKRRDRLGGTLSFCYREAA